MPNLFQPEIADDLAAQRRVREWAGALRSGDYPQAGGTLRTTSGFCCLGLACHLYDETTWRGTTAKGAEWSYMGATIDLPRPIVVAYRLQRPDGHYDQEPDDQRGPWARSLAADNDSGKSFAQIADVIERELDAALGTGSR